MRRILVITLLLEFSILGIVLFALEKASEIKTTYQKVDIFEGEFPSSKPIKDEGNGWTGYKFKGGIYIYRKNSQEALKTFESLYHYYVLDKKLRYTYIPVGDTGVIAFQRLKNGYKIFSIFSVDTFVIWFQLTDKNTTLDSKFEYMKVGLKTLKVNGRQVAREGLENSLLDFRSILPIWLLQSKTQLYLFFLALILLTNIITFIALFKGGKLPAKIEPDWELITPNVLVHEKRPGQYTFYSACIVKKGKSIMIYTFGKLRKTFEIQEGDKYPAFRGNKLLLSDNLKVEFENHDELLKWQAVV
jgi:hypothetical protein